MKSSCYVLQIRDGIIVALMDNQVTARIRSYVDYLQVTARARMIGAEIVCSSTLDFPEDETDSHDVHALCGAIRGAYCPDCGEELTLDADAEACSADSDARRPAVILACSGCEHVTEVP